MENLLQKLEVAPESERLDVLVEQSNVRIERIVSRGHRSPEGFWYDQDHAEWVTVLAGHARLEFEDPPSVAELGPGDHVEIRAHERHRVAWTTPDEPTVWVAVHFW